MAERDPNAPVPAFETRREWLGSTTQESAPAASQPAAAEEKPLGVNVWRDGQVTPLCTVPAGIVWYMILSPDQNWLAVMGWQWKHDGKAERYEISVFSLSSKRLYPLSTACALGMAFTGPHRLAYLEADGTAPKLEDRTGKLLEVSLDETAATLERTTLLDVIPAQTPWLQPLGEDLLLSAYPRTFPGKPTEELSDDTPFKLYHYSRADRGITAIADDVGPLFMPSPDGKRILIEKITPATAAKPVKKELVVVNANGSDGHVLRDLTAYPTLPLWPTWRGNDEITFVPPVDPANPPAAAEDGRIYVDVVLYRLGGEYQLQPLRTLSQKWEQAMKPSYKKPGPPATTQAGK